MTAIHVVQSKLAIIITYIDQLFLHLVEYDIYRELFCWLQNFFDNRTRQTRVGVAWSDVTSLLSGSNKNMASGLPLTGARAYYTPTNLTKTPKFRWLGVRICPK